MPRTKKDLSILDKIILNENIYIYLKESKKFYSKRAIVDIFNEVRQQKEEEGICKVLYALPCSSKMVNGNIPYRLSIFILKYIQTPSFLSEDVGKDWLEHKLGYLFIYDFKDHLILLKRNIGGIQSFVNNLEPLDYSILSKLFEQDGTLYEKFTLSNLDISTKAMRSKTVESDNLVENYNYIGSGSYIINHLRLNNDSQKYLIAVNSSRISKAGEKVSVDQLGVFCYDLIQAIQSFHEKESFVDNFAHPCNYTKERENLSPTIVTLIFSRLIDDLVTGKVTIQYYNNDQARKINFNKYFPGSSLSIDLEKDHQKEFSYLSKNEDNVAYLKFFSIKLYEKSIRLYSTKLSKIKIVTEDRKEPIIDYLNRTNSFVINFNNSEFVYSNRKLFRDSSLLGNIDQFVKIFEDDTDLLNILSEKGNVETNSVSFEKSSVFAYVENKYSSSEFLVLDDIDDEWADHISIEGSTVTFIHSKFDTKVFSATAFTQVVSQALKNLGNIWPVNKSIKSKKTKWERYFKMENTQTKIPRLRKGTSVENFISRYIDVKQNPNPKRKVCLAINFMSKKLLITNLKKLQKDEDFVRRNETTQILWFLSSLIGNCKENSIEVKVFCKP